MNNNIAFNERKIDIIKKANPKIKDVNLNKLIGQIVVNEGEEKIKFIRDFLVAANGLIKEYLLEDMLQILYSHSMKRSEKNSNEYKKTMRNISIKGYKKQFNEEIPEIENISQNDLIYSFLRIAFYSNKITKILCSNSKYYLIESIYSKYYSDFNDKCVEKLEFLDKINEISLKIRSENIINNKQESEERIVKKAIQRNLEEYYKGNYNIINKDNSLFERYLDYYQIRTAEEKFYYLKDESIRQVFMMLANDNYNKFKDWGFLKDKKDNLVFAMDFPYDMVGPFTFHITEPDKIINFKSDIDFSNPQKSYEHPNPSIIIKNFSRHGKPITYLNKEFNISILQSIISRLDEIEKYNINIAAGISQSNSTPKNIISKRNMSEKEQRVYNAIKDYLTSNNFKNIRILAAKIGSTLDINSSIYSIEKFAKEECGINQIKFIKTKEILDIEQKKLKELLENNNLTKEEEIQLKELRNTLYLTKVSPGDSIVGAINLNLDKSIFDNRDADISDFEKNRTIKIHSEYLPKCGIYMPPSIVKLSNYVFTDEVLDPRNGLLLAQNIRDGSKLFEFAEMERNGKSLLELSLTDDEIEKFGLQELYQERINEAEQAKEIKENENKYGYKFKEGEEYKKILIIPEFIPYGSRIAYAFDYDYYASIAEHSSGKGATFSITANPNKGDGRLPKEILRFGRNLREQEGLIEDNEKNKKYKVFVNERFENWIIVGGLKQPDICIYDDMESKEAHKLTLKAILHAFDIEKYNSNDNRILEKILEFNNKDKGKDRD